eukprot:TRINITY_DN101932_c0_g1_i1.p1 TRINITY_DN101932_c0_g1~~TRINITY_DN101932_c0_g1_i1.p1  ORF type:complete len:411 (+),score=102.99 TRINITY_DN101932_c0_g1_i1:61-1233(+)
MQRLLSRRLGRHFSLNARAPAAVHRTGMRWSSSSAGDEEVLFEEHGAARLVTLNRPKALNALNWPMVKRMSPWYAQWRREHEQGQSRVIVIRAEGGKAFCAGGDVVALATDSEGSLRRGFFRDEYRLNYAMKTLPFPHIALLDGFTMGGGVGLSMHGSHRIVMESTMFAMPETGIGLFPDVGGSVFLPHLPYPGLGMFIALTGHRLKGADCLHAGIGTHFIDRARLSELQGQLLQQSNAADVEKVLAEFAVPAASLPAFTLEGELEAIGRTFTKASVEEILKALENEGSEWSSKTLKTLGKMSPTSLKVTHEQLVRGAKQTPAENFAMEARMAWAMMNVGTDFNEGIRALLIDKDKNPKWSPATLEEVTPEVVAKYFASLGDDEWTPADN